MLPDWPAMLEPPLDHLHNCHLLRLRAARRRRRLVDELLQLAIPVPFKLQTQRVTNGVNLYHWVYISLLQTGGTKEDLFCSIHFSTFIAAMSAQIKLQL